MSRIEDEIKVAEEVLVGMTKHLDETLKEKDDAEAELLVLKKMAARMEAQVYYAQLTHTSAEGALVKARNNLYNLQIELQKNEAAAAAAAAAAAEEAQQKAAKPIGTKFKWISKANDYTYRVAIQTNYGVLQVKSVKDGHLDCHDDGCDCVPCWEFAQKAPWRNKPLKKIFFANEYEWRNSFYEYDGDIVITPAPISDKALKELCNKPLISSSDSNKLKELEERFPGGTFVLVIKDLHHDVISAGDYIFSKHANVKYRYFDTFGDFEKPTLMVEWRGLYINLSHLF